MAVFFCIPEPETYHDTQTVVTYLQFIACCNSLVKPPGRQCFVANKWTALYTIVIGLTLTFGLCYSINAKVTDPIQLARIRELDSLVLSITFMELLSTLCMFIVSSSAMLWHSQRHVAFLERIHELDLILIREFGANLNYRKLMRKNIGASIVFTVIYASAVSSASGALANGDYSTFFMGAWFYAIMTGGTHLCGYVHMNLSETLKIRFRLMQRILNRDYLMRHFPNEKLREQRLERAIELVKSFHQIVPEINTVYMLALLSALMHDFTLTTSEMYMIFGSSIFDPTNKRLLVYVTGCMMLPFYKMFVAPIYSHISIEEGKKCLQIIGRLDDWFPKSRKVRQMVASAMYWRLSNKINIKVGVNILMNKSIITMWFTGVINYLLVLIQFRMTQEIGNQFEVQTNTLHAWIGENE